MQTVLTKNIHYIGLNFVSQERLDPLIFGFLSLLGLGQSQLVYVCAQLLVLAAGVSLLMAVTRSRGTLLGGVWACSALFLLFGLEPFYLKFQWFPWMLAGLILLLLRNSAKTLVLCATFTLLWIASAGALAPLGIVVAASAAVVISLRMRSFTLVVAEGSRKYTSFSIITALAFLVALIYMPRYPMPDYPTGARLVVDSIFEYLPFPLLGERLHPVPVVGTVFFALLALYAQNYLLLLLSLVIGLGVSALLWGENVRLALRQVLTHGVLCAIVIFSLLFWPQQLIGHHPFVLLMRLIPGVGFVFLPWALLPFSILFLAIGLFAHCSRRVIALAIVATWITSFGLAVSGNSSPSQAHFAEFGVESERSPYIGVSWSPSATVVATMGPWVATPGVAKQRDFSSLKRLQSGFDYVVANVEAVPNNSLAPRAIDGNVFTSWGTGRKQMPGDYFLLEFENPISVARVALSIQETPRSYPCSLSVWSRDSEGVDRELYVQDPWPGPVFWTEQGFPYFGEKRRVILDFPNRQKTTSLRFEVLSSNCGVRSWSIGELKFYDIVKPGEEFASN